MSNRRNIQFTYTPHNKATILDCQFTVAHTDAAGYGVNNLNKSGRIATVYMESSVPNALSPDPAAGYICVTLQDNYNHLLDAIASFSSPVSGTSLSISGSGMTVSGAYVITALGTSSQAAFQVIGLPANITAAVGVSFIASATGGATGTGTVAAPISSGIDHIELVGNPNLMNANGAYTLGNGQGMSLIFACYKNTVLTAPTDGSVIAIQFYLNDSAQGV
jgi:hypothetical protein